MASEEPAILSHHNGDDRTRQSAGSQVIRLCVDVVDRAFAYLPNGGLANCCCIFSFAWLLKELLVGLDALPTRSFEEKDLLNMMTVAER